MQCNINEMLDDDDSDGGGGNDVDDKNINNA